MTTLGELLNAVVEADNEASVIRAQLTEKERTLREAEEALLLAMQEQGVDRVRNDYLTVTLTTKSRPHVVDWEAFYEIVSQHPQLLERRVSAKPFAELLESRNGEPIPGVQLYEYTGIRKSRE